MRTQANEPAATTLARGVAKTSDIEGARRDLARAERCTADRLHETAERLGHEADRLADGSDSAEDANRPDDQPAGIGAARAASARRGGAP